MTPRDLCGRAQRPAAALLLSPSPALSLLPGFKPRVGWGRGRERGREEEQSRLAGHWAKASLVPGTSPSL